MLPLRQILFLKRFCLNTSNEKWLNFNFFFYRIPFGPLGTYFFGLSHQYITRFANFSLNFLYLEAKFDDDYFITVYFLGSSHCTHIISANFEQKQRYCDFRGRTGKKPCTSNNLQLCSYVCLCEVIM